MNLTFLTTINKEKRQFNKKSKKAVYSIKPLCWYHHRYRSLVSLKTNQKNKPKTCALTIYNQTNKKPLKQTCKEAITWPCCLHTSMHQHAFNTYQQHATTGYINGMQNNKNNNFLHHNYLKGLLADAAHHGEKKGTVIV